jgi:MFS family permease
MGSVRGMPVVDLCCTVGCVRADAPAEHAPTPGSNDMRTTGRGRHARETGFRAALSARDFRAMLAAFAVSRAGDFLYNITLVVVVLDRTGSAAWVAAMVTLRLVPYVLLRPLAGVLADRVDRVRLMVASDLARAVLMAVLAILVAAEAHPATLIAVASIAGCAGTPHMSAFMATVPRAVPERGLAGANALVSGVEYVAVVVGPASSVALLALGSHSLPFWLNMVTFLWSAALLRGVRLNSDTDTQQAKDDGPSAPATTIEQAKRRSVRADLAEGFSALRADRTLAVLTICLIALTFTYGFEMVYLVLVSERQLDLGASGVGLLEAAVGVGGVLGVALAAKLAQSTRPAAVIAGIVVFCALPMTALSVIHLPALALAVLLVEGAAAVALDVVVVTTMQRVVPADRLARVDGILGSLSLLGTVTGSLLAVPLLAVAGLPLALVIASSAPAALALTGLVRARLIDPRSEAAATALAPKVELLASSNLFSGVLRPSLELLATRATPEHVPAGTVVLREGDAADHLFLLVVGSCEVRVHRDGVELPLGLMEAPDFFGEIGVLQQRPRTATVVTRSDCELLRIEGADFAATVGRGDAMSGPLRQTVATRLARTG